jgi:hypothetical protein
MYSEYSFWLTNPETMADLNYLYTEEVFHVEKKQEIIYEKPEQVGNKNVAGFIPKYYNGS